MGHLPQIVTMICNVLNIVLVWQTIYNHLLQSRARVYAVNTPAGSTVQDFMHFFQIIRTGRFARFNYDDKPACYPVNKSNQGVYGHVSYYKLCEFQLCIICEQSCDSPGPFFVCSTSLNRDTSTIKWIFWPIQSVHYHYIKYPPQNMLHNIIIGWVWSPQGCPFDCTVQITNNLFHLNLIHANVHFSVNSPRVSAR